MRLLFLCLIGAAVLGGCRDAEPEPFTGDPIVAVHGFLASGDTWSPVFRNFSAHGYPATHLRTYDYNSLADDAVAIEGLDAFIDALLNATGAERVVLMGHSKGGGLGYTYLSDPARADKVARYVHIGSFPADSAAGPTAGAVPMLNLWSPDDLVVSGADIPGAENRSLAGLDHYEVATSAATIEAIWDFVRDDPWPGPIPAEDGLAVVAGKALTLGENRPLAGGSVRIWALDADGMRRTEEPLSDLAIAEDGTWGPVTLESGVAHEYRVQGASGRAVHYFREPEVDDGWAYLRTIPPPTSIAGLLLAGLPREDGQAVVAVFSSSQAVVAGRDALTVDGTDLATPTLASADQTTIAYFLYDDGDGVSSGTPDPGFAAFPFLQAVDRYFPTDPPATVRCTFNGRELAVRNLRSASDGLVVAVFR
jgi:pimeloyl-ACP methyl ester carboxylesterase